MEETNTLETIGKTHYSNDAAAGKKPPRLSMETLRRTISDMSFEFTTAAEPAAVLPAITEAVVAEEEAKCECCGMTEECTAEYMKRVREKYAGKLVCGLCSEAVKEAMERKGTGENNGNNKKVEEALTEHMNACVRFNRVGRAFPVLCQAQAMRQVLKNSRGKSLSPRDHNNNINIKKGGGGLARSSSCIPAIIAKDLER